MRGLYMTVCKHPGLNLNYLICGESWLLLISRWKMMKIGKGKRPLVKPVVLSEVRSQRRLGGAKESILFIADDFDAPLADFADSAG